MGWIVNFTLEKTELLIACFCSLLRRSSANGDHILCDDADFFFVLGVTRRNFNKNMVLYPPIRGLWTTSVDWANVRVPTKSKDAGKKQRVTEFFGDLDATFCIFVTVTQMDMESRWGIFTGRCIASQEIGNLEVLQLYDGKPTDRNIPLQPTGQVATRANINLRMYKKEEYQVRPELKKIILTVWEDWKKSCRNG